MKTIKIGQLNFWPCDGEDVDALFGKNRTINVINYCNKFSNKYKYEYGNCFKENCDIVFYSLYNDIERLKLCKGNPMFIYWTDEYSCIGHNHAWNDPFNFYRQGNLSISFYADSETNCYFPYGILFYHDVINTKTEYNKQTFQKDKFCTFCASNAIVYQAAYRTNFVKYISENYKEVTCCGKVLNNTNGEYLPYNLGEARKYHDHYKFNLCFENEFTEGNSRYITEKIFNAFAYNTVPIYWGSTYIDNIFNKEAFINCNGLTYEESLKKIIEVDNDNELYDHMLNQWPFKESSINYEELFFRKLNKFIETHI